MTSTAPDFTPVAEVEIDESLVRHLLAHQFPSLASLPIGPMEAGWDNVMVRLGNDLAVRLPRRAATERFVLHEQKWLPILAPQLPVAIPVPLHAGVPLDPYPFHWSVLRWHAGQAADLAPPDDDQAAVVVRFLKALHAISLPANPPANPMRDCPLTGKQVDIERRMSLLAATRQGAALLTPALLAAWRHALALPAALKSCWVAGDIHARNVVTHGGKIVSFVDWGDICAGDPASDLACIWALFRNAAARRSLIDAYGMDEALQCRSMGWAIFYGVILAETGMRDTPRHFEMGMAMLERVNRDLAGRLAPA